MRTARASLGRPLPKPPLAQFVAEVGGALIGVAQALELRGGGLPPGKFLCGVDVAPHHRGKGVGRALTEALSQSVMGLGPSEIWVDVDLDDLGAVSFAGFYGLFPEDDGHEPEQFAQAVSDTEAERFRAASRELPKAVHILEIDEQNLDMWLGPLHETYSRVFPEQPGDGKHEAIPIEEFRRVSLQDLEDGGALLIGVRGDEVVSGSWATRAAWVPVAHADFTMVRRQERGLGLGRATKAALSLWAIDHGVRMISCDVHKDNPWMRSINASLGYLPIRHQMLIRSLRTGDQTDVASVRAK